MGEFGGIPDPLKPERCALKIALMRWISNAYFGVWTKRDRALARPITRIAPWLGTGRVRRHTRLVAPRRSWDGALAGTGSVDGRLASPAAASPPN